MTQTKTQGPPLHMEDPAANSIPEDQLSNIPRPNVKSGLTVPALWWASKGYVVLPLKRMGNIPHHMLGKFGSFSTVGSSDPDQILNWWRSDKAANIGIVTGVRSRLLVVDCDLKLTDGKTMFHQWCSDRAVSLDGVPYVNTPSGGRHYYFRLVEDCKSPIGWLNGVDIRANGAQVATAPSVRQITYPREFKDNPRESPARFVEYRAHGDFERLPEVPPALLEDIRSHGSRAVGPEAERTLVEQSPELDFYVKNGLGAFTGSRDRDALILARVVLNKTNGNREQAEIWVQAAWSSTSQAGHPFTWREAEKCIDSAERYWRAEADYIPAWRP